jgi:hypothetical protein
MIRDIAYDLQDTQIHSQVWRCVCCGGLVDPLILRNRMKQSVLSRPSSPQSAAGAAILLSLVA